MVGAPNPNEIGWSKLTSNVFAHRPCPYTNQPNTVIKVNWLPRPTENDGGRSSLEAGDFLGVTKTGNHVKDTTA